MRGFRTRSSLAEALKWLDAWLDLALERRRRQTPSLVSLTQCVGRVLAADVVSQHEMPPFTRAMMDGYAVRSEALAGARSDQPRPLVEIGVCLPGEGFDGSVAGNQAVRIMTGAPTPEGADVVLPVEQTRRDDDGLWALAELPSGKHVGRIGEDFAAGQTMLPRGRRLRPQDAGLLSSLGINDVAVIPRPHVAICVTGDELLPMGSAPQGYRFADSNGPMLMGLAVRDGARVVMQTHAPDDRATLRSVLHTAADIILLTGGSSVGQADYAPVVLAEEGELAIHGINMRPGRPIGLGAIGDALVVLLPGNPVSCLCAYDFFAGRAIRRLGGRSPEWPYRSVQGRLTRELASQPGLVEYARVHYQGGEVEPVAIGGSSLLSSATRADGFVVIDADCECLPTGAEVQVWLYD
jgi:molybdopterin molybdotransferase